MPQGSRRDGVTYAARDSWAVFLRRCPHKKVISLGPEIGCWVPRTLRLDLTIDEDIISLPTLVRVFGKLLRSSSGCRNPSVQFQGLTSLCPLCVGIHQGRPTGLSTDLQARSVSDAI